MIGSHYFDTRFQIFFCHVPIIFILLVLMLSKWYYVSNHDVVFGGSLNFFNSSNAIFQIVSPYSEQDVSFTKIYKN